MDVYYYRKMESLRPYSVVNGRDSDVLPILFEVHHPNAKNILDCTYNKGRMWKGTPYQPIRMDIDSKYDVDVVGDFRYMPFVDNSFDVIVFDPPHRPIAAGKTSAYAKYNEGELDKGREGDNVSDLFLPFLKEAKRVLRDEGVIFAKIADLTHNHKYQWQHVDFINYVIKVNLTPCDLIIKIDPCAGNLKSSKWKNIKHFRKKHCYWIVVRKGGCEYCG